MPVSYEIGPCPACGSASSTTVVSADDVRDELEQLWAFHTRRLHGRTPPALLYDRVAFSQRPPLAIARCDQCTLVFRNPRERAHLLVELYRDEAPQQDAMRTLFDNQSVSYAAQAARLTDVFGGTGRGLEVGSYVGAFLHAARTRGWDFVGVDVNETVNSFVRARGEAVFAGTIDDVPADNRYDVIAFWNCFDQLPEPVVAADAARARLRDGGMLALRVPNGDFYLDWRNRLATRTRGLARAALAHNNLLAFPYRHGFTVQSLTMLLERTGFRATHWHGDVSVPIADRWTRRWAAVEERLVKGALAALPAERSPWLEVYARAV
jgi:SAM-dependent methyltransferase